MEAAPLSLKGFIIRLKSGAVRVGVGSILTYCLCLCLATSAQAEKKLRVDLIVGSPSAPQTQFIKALERALVREPAVEIELHQRSVDERPNAQDTPDADLRVALGTRAALAVAKAEVSSPRLYGLIPRSTWRQIKACCSATNDRDSALFLDRMPIDYLRLAQAVSPLARRYGVLLGPVSKSVESELRRAASQLGVDLAIGWVENSDEVGPALRKVIEDVGVVVALPDPAVFNSNTVYPLLLASYGARLPVVAYSNALVKAGAAAAVFISPEEAGGDVANEILRFATTRELGPAKSSPSLSVRVNEDVLRSLGIEGLDEAVLLEHLRGGAL